MSWTEDDPGHGDQAVIARFAADLQTQADDAATASRQLRGLQEQTTTAIWRGEAADAFRDRIGRLPSQLDKVQASYQQAADGMRAYAAAVQQIADDASAQHRLITAAQAEHDSAVAASAAWTAPLDPTGVPLPQNPHTEAVAAARAALVRGHAQLQQLADERTVADQRVIATLEQAHHAGMKNKPWWQTVLDVASKALAKITILLTVIAIVAIVVLAVVQPELIPGLLLVAGEALSTLSAAQLAVDTTRDAVGEDVSWGFVGDGRGRSLARRRGTRCCEPADRPQFRDRARCTQPA